MHSNTGLHTTLSPARSILTISLLIAAVGLSACVSGASGGSGSGDSDTSASANPNKGPGNSNAGGKNRDDSTSDDTTPTEDDSTTDEGDDVVAEPDSEETTVEPLTLSWTAPTERQNGDSLTLSDIDRYALYVGTASGDYDAPIEIPDTGENTYALDFLEPGTYYIAMKAADTDGLWSTYSEEVQVTVQ